MTRRRLTRARKIAASVTAGLLSASLLSGAQALQGTGAVRAGIATADISWHVGAGQGQYGSTGNTATSNKFDPYLHGTKMSPTDGIQARLFARALVVEGPDGQRVAYVKHDLYLQQDVLHRRVAQLVEEAGVGINRERLMIGATHNHSAPYFATTSFGVMLFTDTFDYRQFDYLARKMAGAVVEAAQRLVPVRMAATVVRLDEVQQNILGPRTADDGTPAGFPRDYFDDELTVVRFDDLSDGISPRPLAALVNLGMHPESLATSDMYSPDFVGVVERIAGRATGATIVWSQGSVGDVEPDRDARAHPPAEKHEYWHRDFAQAERMSRIVAARVVEAWEDAAAPASQVLPREVAGKHVPFSTSFPVQMVDMTFAGPVTHPLPTYGNCRTDPITEKGQVRTPGLPTCNQATLPIPPGVALDPLRDAGVPVPDQYAWTSFEGVQETFRVHLQVIRLGEVLLASCPCEPVSDMVRNFKSRTDLAAGSIFDGFDWPCRPLGTGFECNYKTASYKADDWRPVAASLYAKMQAEIHNDAAGWEDLENASIAESEPSDVSKIKGNFTKEEIGQRCPVCPGYRLPLMVGQANDYVGYIVTYREYQSGDHYRKALTPFGPHTADFVNTRLVRMAAMLQGGPPLADAVLDRVLAAEEHAVRAKLLALGQAAATARMAYEAALPDDGGAPGVVAEPPAALERFGAAQFRWTGGSNYTDNPVVTVQRRVGDGWQTVATQEGGEVVVTLTYGRTNDPAAAASWATGELANTWTATFEVLEGTPPGEYRFAVAGHHREDGAPGPYALGSQPFLVRPWSGIRVSDGGFDAATGTARFTVAPIAYPTTYLPAAVPYIKSTISNTPTGAYCFRCTFRPWASSGSVASATVTVRHPDGSATSYPAAFDGAAWVASGIVVSAGDVVAVEPGGVADEFGNVNGEAFLF